MALSNRGFSILEAMQASALAALALAGVSSMLLNTIHANSKASRITTAATFAEAKMEELRSLSPASIVDGTDGVTVPSGVTYTRTWRIVTGPASGTKSLTLTVESEAGETVELRTILLE